MATADTASPKRGSGAKRTMLIAIAALVALLIAWLVVAFMIFRARAEGIATGYLEAAATAYQMDRYSRPMPDRIFETGSYRVATTTHGDPPTFEVSVRHALTNITFVTMARVAERAGTVPMPSTLPPSPR